MIIEVLKEELERLQRMEESYLDKIASLPKGSIQYKSIHGRRYPYLIAREGNQVKSIYLKLDEAGLNELSFQIEQRRKFERLLDEIKRDRKIILRTINNE